MFGQRKKQLRKTALELNMQFHEYDDYHAYKDLQIFEALQSKRNYRHMSIENILYRFDQLLQADVEIFDYQYHIYDEDEMEDDTVRTSIFHIRSEKLNLPMFVVKPKTVFNHIGKLFVKTEEKFDFSLHPKFGLRYKVIGGDVGSIQYCLKDPILDLFSNEGGWTLECAHQHILFYENDRRQATRDIPSFHDRGIFIFENLIKSGGVGYV